jgi:hypothetical protein
VPRLDGVARCRLARALVSLEGVIAHYEAHATEDVEPKLKRLRHLRDDIRVVLGLAHQDAARRSQRG